MGVLEFGSWPARAAVPGPGPGPAPAATTPKWLVLGESGARWRLPDETNVDHLEIVIRAAIRTGTPLSIEVEEDSTGRSCIVLNGRSLTYVVLSEG